MSSKRKVTLKLTTQKDLIKHESNARTYGELQSELKDVKFSGMRVVERSSKMTLQHDDAILPAGDFVLFLVPEKVKSGTGNKKLKDISTANYNELRSHASHLNKKQGANIPMGGGTEDIRKAVKAYYDSKNPASPKSLSGESADRIAAIEEARTKINEAIDVIIANAGEAKVVEDATEYLIKTSVDDLEDELKSIKNALKL